MRCVRRDDHRDPTRSPVADTTHRTLLLGAAEVERFLTDLAVHGQVSASTQNQALCALVFLYAQVLEIDLGRFDAVRARRPKRPVPESSR